jgi:hypothetical protein
MSALGQKAKCLQRHGRNGSAEPVLRLAEGKAWGLYAGYAWKAQWSFACARASAPSAMNLCRAARDKQPRFVTNRGTCRADPRAAD